MGSADIDPAVFAYMTRLPDERRPRGYLDALVVVLLPESAPDGVLNLGAFLELRSEPELERSEDHVQFLIPVKKAMDEGPAGSPYKLIPRSAGSGVAVRDMGYWLSDEHPAPPPLIFDADDVPDGVYWIATSSGYSPVRIWHPS